MESGKVKPLCTWWFPPWMSMLLLVKLASHLGIIHIPGVLHQRAFCCVLETWVSWETRAEIIFATQRFLSFKKVYFCRYFACMFSRASHMCLPGACGSHKNSDTLELELQAVVSCHVGAGYWTLVLYISSQCSLQLTWLSSPCDPVLRGLIEGAYYISICPYGPDFPPSYVAFPFA